MPKMKTHKATSKRFRVSGSGLIMMTPSGRRHKLGKKDSKRKRHMRKAEVLTPCDQKNIRQLIPYK
ncbi:MAG: 50S ribosomal protein L35 [Clostridia bacterium]|nr:50S ribosomal protein L35 [Clostridia bacterium]